MLGSSGLDISVPAFLPFLSLLTKVIVTKEHISQDVGNSREGNPTGDSSQIQALCRVTELDQERD